MFKRLLSKHDGKVCYALYYYAQGAVIGFTSRWRAVSEASLRRYTKTNLLSSTPLLNPHLSVYSRRVSQRGTRSPFKAKIQLQFFLARETRTLRQADTRVKYTDEGSLKDLEGIITAL